jgi:protein import protein ZIM17
MGIVFTCAKCDTRAVKSFTRQAYEAGVVLITCPGCQSMHLIADHLGWFGDDAFKVCVNA